jgi:hypothetical protein
LIWRPLEFSKVEASQVSLADLTLPIYAQRRQFAPSALVDLPFLPSSIV